LVGILAFKVRSPRYVLYMRAHPRIYLFLPCTCRNRRPNKSRTQSTFCPYRVRTVRWRCRCRRLSRCSLGPCRLRCSLGYDWPPQRQEYIVSIAFTWVGYLCSGRSDLCKFFLLLDFLCRLLSFSPCHASLVTVFLHDHMIVENKLGLVQETRALLRPYPRGVTLFSLSSTIRTPLSPSSCHPFSTKTNH
jgi:hypothetical protein